MSFSAAEAKFLQRLVAGKPPFRRNDGVAKRVLEGHGIGTASGSKVLYGLNDIEAARKALAVRGIPLDQAEGGYSRSEAGGGLSEKSGARAVTDGLVAVICLNMDGRTTEAGCFSAVHWEEAAEWPFECLLECENLEAFLRLSEYSWLKGFIRGRAVLAVYRGGPHFFRPGAAASLLARLEKPVLGFYDFDPAGLAIAAGEPNLEALCLPEWTELLIKAREMRRPSLYYPQLKTAQGVLENLRSGPVFEAWVHLKKLKWGLDQESFPR